MINKIKCIAIIGYGSIANKHISIIEKLYPKIKIYIVTKRKFRSKHKICRNFDDLKNIELEAIFITSPTDEHFNAIKFFYKKDLNLFVEKPIFEKRKNVNFLFNNISKNDSPILQVGYVFRHDDLFLKFKSLCNKNILGQILKSEIYCGSDLNSWRPNTKLKHSISLNKNKGGGVLLELSHEIDYCLWLFGDLKVKFSKLYRSGIFDSKVEDTADIYLLSRNKVNINMHLNFWQKTPERYCKIHGTKGFILLDIINRKIIIKSDSINKSISFQSKLNEAYENQIKNFFYSINKRKKSVSNLRESLKVLDIIEEAKKLNRSKKNV